MEIIKSKEEALALREEILQLENADRSKYTPEEKKEVSKQILNLLTLSQNVCPHETIIRRKDLDAPGVETWECQDCFNLNYISIKE